MKIVIRGSTLKNISKWALGQPTSVSYHYIDKDVVTLFSHRGHFTLLNNFKFNTMSTFSRLYQHTLTRVTFSMQEFYLWHHLYLIQKCLNKSWEEKNAFFLFFSKENRNKTNIVTFTSVKLTKKVFFMQVSLCLPLSTQIKPSRLHMNCLTFLQLFSAFSLLPVEDCGIKLLMTGKEDKRLRGKWITWETLSFWSWKYLVYESSSPAVSNKAAAITSSLGARVNTVSDFLYRYVKLAIPRKVHIFLNWEKKLNTREKKIN